MKCKFSLFIFILQIAFSSLTALEVCKKHFNEIYDFQRIASEFVAEAHKSGGYLFRSSFVFTPYDAAMNTFRMKYTYTEFSEAFRDFMYYCNPKGIQPLFVGYSEITDRFYNLYTECIANHQNIHAYYERGKIYFNRGLYDDCLADIQPIINSGEWNNSTDDKDQQNAFLLTQGQAQVENGAYDAAISTLSDLIKRDPSNKMAYFNRALAYFEMGAFENAIRDYLISEKSKAISKIKSKTSTEFTESLLKGLTQGGIDSVNDFFPSLWHSTYGLGETLWSFTQHPINTTKNFCNACYDIGEVTTEYFKTLDWNTIEGYGAEIKQLCEKFDHLSDAEKGHLIGYSIGKYGVDIFAGATAIKGVMAVKKLKNANRICNLEAMTISEANKEMVIASSVQHASNRESFFRNIRLISDQQNKHIPGKHNYQHGKSVFEHKDPQGLLCKFAGKGRPLNNEMPGNANYRELVDFGEHIGVWKNKENTLALPTSKGTIHYSRDGAHIIPAHPESLTIK
jgi:tetratricopeptide (TPR) repeat protein